MRILITGGGCEEALDNVRSLCNFSSGLTASRIGEALIADDHEVVALMGKRALAPAGVSAVYRFTSSQDLAQKLQEVLQTSDFDVIIHSAAVSDYRPAVVEVDGKPFIAGKCGKIPSDAEVVIRLAKNPKLIDQLRSWSRNKNCLITGFKLTSGAHRGERALAVSDLLERSLCDLVVSNDTSQISPQRHAFRVFARHGFYQRFVLDLVGEGETLEELALFFQRVMPAIYENRARRNFS